MNLKRIVEIFPLLGSFLILLGYLKLYLYYDHWDIAIIDYLDISEITLLFLGDVHLIIAFIAIYLFPLTIGMVLIRWTEEGKKDTPAGNEEKVDESPKNDASSPNTPFEVVESIISSRQVFMWVSLILLVVFIWLFFVYNKVWLLYFSVLGFMNFSSMFSEYLFEEKKKQVLQASFVTTSIAFSVLVTHYDIRKTESNASIFETVVVTRDSAFHTNSNLIQVGKTSRFVFIYDVPGKVSHTIKMDEVKEIYVKETVNYN